MARENQGLQIALIIFVMLTIVLGVTTFLFFRRYDESETKAEKAFADATTQKSNADRKNEENNRLKQMMGFAVTEEMQTIDTAFAKDMQDYAGTFPDDQRYYRPLVKQLYDTINARNTQLVAVQAEIEQLKDKYAVREASKDGQIQAFDAATKKAGDELVAERTKFGQERKRVTDDQAQVAAALAKSRKDAVDAVDKIDAQLKEAGGRLDKMATLLATKSRQLEDVTKETVDIPDGEVRWVNQRTGTVWVNLGRADNLSRQTSFSVYAADSTDLTKTGKKASVQITQILGDHLAEARIVEDQVSNPIMPGDKIFTPVWSTGEQKHFAIAGVVDLDGDGRSDMQTLCNLIEMNGGVVDAWHDDKGEKQGEVSINTRYLVIGDAPSTKGSQQAVLAVYSKMIGEADRLGIKKLPLPELLQRMGWKNQTPVVRYGLGANPADFRAKPPEGVAPVSRGNVTDAFKPRNPPRVGAGGAY